MSIARSTGIGMLLFCAAAPGAIAADTWNVENNFNRDFKLVIKPAGGNAEEYALGAGATVPIRLGAEPHTFVTSLADGTQRQTHREKRLKPIADNGLTLLKEIRSPIGIKLPNNTEIYQAMPDYPYSREYDGLVNDLRQSRWSGTYSGQRGSLSLRGNAGTADSGTRLENVQYVPGDTFVVAGTWKHAGENGEFILLIDPKNPTQLTGHYRYKGRNWLDGTGKR